MKMSKLLLAATALSAMASAPFDHIYETNDIPRPRGRKTFKQNKRKSKKRKSR